MLDDSDLTKSEKSLVSCAKRGQTCKLGEGDPAAGLDWAKERMIRAHVILDLCTTTEGRWLLNPKGVRLEGARIEGKLDFEHATLCYPLHMIRCHIGEPLCLDYARLPCLVLSGSHVHSIQARSAEVAGSVVLDSGFRTKSEVRCGAASIGGDFDAKDGVFENLDGNAIFADSLRCLGSVYLSQGFSAGGAVNLSYATIGQDLDCSGGTFRNRDRDALQADGIKCKGSVLLGDRFSARGAVTLFGASIGQNLYASGGTFCNANGYALAADRLDCKGSVFLGDKCLTKGQVRFPYSSIGGAFDASGGTFDNAGAENSALFADALACKGSINFKGSRVKGGARFAGANIGGNLECCGAEFDNQNGCALNVQALHCRGGILLAPDFSARGEVSLHYAFIGALFNAERSSFHNPDGYALQAENLECKGNVFLRNGFQSTGEVRLRSASLAGSLLCEGGVFQNDGGVAMDLQHATVAGEFSWDCLSSTLRGQVNLSGARVGLLKDAGDQGKADAEGGQLLLDAFVYERMQPRDRDRWLNWLKRASFATQPYEQLAGIYRALGQRLDVVEVLIAKEKARNKSSREPWLVTLWSRLLGLVVGFGYKPSRALVGLVALGLLGAVIFGSAHAEQLMVRLDTKYGDFDGVVYSFDTLLPIIDLHMESYWEPVGGGVGLSHARLVWWYLRLHIVMGWFLTTVGVLAVTGIVRKES
jgi:hypothetical protein